MRDKICFVSIDVERGIEGLEKILAIFKKYNVPATLFVTGEILQQHAGLLRELNREYEITCHGFTHRFWDTLNRKERKKELEDFISLYQNIFKEKPGGFRAPSHIIDKAAIELLQEKGFLYDSSIVPHYPPFKKYRGYKGKKPREPYYPEGLEILEIPVSGQILGIPLAGAWVKKLPPWFYRILFLFYSPQFLTLSMHSWDVLDPRFLGNLDKILSLLKLKNYQFLNGREIFHKNRRD